MENEIWKPTLYDNLDVSNWGRVRKLKKSGEYYILKPQITKCSDWQTNKTYIWNAPHIFHKKKRIQIHRLVAMVFLSNVKNKTMVDHIDNRNYNNFYKNLRWANPSENNNNKTTHWNTRCRNNPLIIEELERVKMESKDFDAHTKPK